MESGKFFDKSKRRWSSPRPSSLVEAHRDNMVRDESSRAKTMGQLFLRHPN